MTKPSITQFEHKSNNDAPVKVDVKNLQVFYGKFRALAGVDLAVRENQITAIIGPSGCGKSTLLRSFNRMNDLTARLPGAGRSQPGWGESFMRPVWMWWISAGGSGWSSSVPTRSPNPSTIMSPMDRACTASGAARTCRRS